LLPPPAGAKRSRDGQEVIHTWRRSGRRGQGRGYSPNNNERATRMNKLDDDDDLRRLGQLCTPKDETTQSK